MNQNARNAQGTHAWRALPVVLAAALWQVAATVAQAQTPTTWTGASNASWGTGSNWSGAVVPGASSDATFDLARNTFLNVSGTVNRLIFSNTATIAGSASGNNASATLQINNGLTHTANNSGNSFMRIQTVALGGNQTWNLNGTNGLNNNGANGFTIVPNGPATVANTFSLNGYTLTKTGSGQVVFGGVTIGDGSIDINEGSVRFATFGSGGSGPLTTVGGTGTIFVRGGAAVLFAVGSNVGRFNVTKPIRMEGTVGSPSTMQTNGSVTLTGTIASPIEWAGVSNLEHYWAVGTNRRFEFTGNWTGSGTVSTVLTSTTAPTQESVITLSGSNGGFGGLVDNVYSGTGAGVSWVQFGSANAGSANAEWKLSNANASYRLNGLSVSLGALSGTAGTLSNGGLNAGIGAAVATIGGKGIDSTFSGLITDGSAALSVVKTGAGTLTLGGANTYSGLTDVQAGRLAYGISNALGGGAVQVSGGSLDIATFSDSVGTVTLTSGSIAGTTGVLSGTAYDVRSGAISAILGGSGVGLTKLTSGTVTLGGVNAYTGVTAVNAGTLAVNGSIAASSGVGVASGATLGGSGAVSVISGAGLVSPGNSPGILTATSIDPSTGMDFAFELTGTGSPAYGNASNSVNDVLRLTAATPALSALTTNNVVSIYFDGSIVAGDTFRGGTYVDSATTLGARDAFATAIGGADWQYYVYGNGGGTHSFNGMSYYTLGEYDPGLTITRTVVADSANFGGGTVNGAVTQFVVVPEPGALALALAGLGGFMAWSARQWSRRAA
jgi:autotransporter-associated beta strand protein